MPPIDLDHAPARPEPRSRRARLVAALTSPAPTALVLAVAALVVVAARVPDPRPAAQVMHEVRVGVSDFPAKATAWWRDRAGATHELDPWGDAVRVPAREVLVAVASDGAQCSVVVDGVTVDTATARDGVAVCSWVG